MASKEPSIVGRCQLSSTNFRMEDWSVTVWSMKLCFAHGEMTNSGRRGPKPQRPFSPPSGVCLVVSPHSPVPVRKSCGPGALATVEVFEGLWMPL